MISEKHKCPACNHLKAKYVSDFDFTQEGNGYFPDTFNVLECLNCKIWFKNSIPSKEVISEFYKSLPTEGSHWEYISRLPHEKRIDKILNKLPNDSEVLDVGCWTGRLLSIHQNVQRFGIEPNKVSGIIAESKGIKIIGETVEDEILKNRMFDIITMVDVFEHLDNPLEVIDILVSHLKPGGKLIIITGASDSMAVKLANITYWYFCKIPDHIVFINKGFINWLRDRYGNFNINSERVRHYNYKAINYLKELTWLLIWRYLNPNSLFKKNNLLKIFSVKRFENLKEIIMCNNQKDHLLTIIDKKY